jgi:hypothetical protein
VVKSSTSPKGEERIGLVYLFSSLLEIEITMSVCVFFEVFAILFCTNCLQK